MSWWGIWNYRELEWTFVSMASRSPRAQGIVFGASIAVFVALFASIVLWPFVD